MNRIKILSVAVFLLFLGATSTSTAAVSRSSISPTFPIQKPSDPDKGGSCRIATPAVEFKADPVEVNVPEAKKIPSFTKSPLVSVPGEPDKGRYQPYGNVASSEGGNKAAWKRFTDAVDDIPSAASRREITRLRSNLNNKSRTARTLIKTISKKQRSYATALRNFEKAKNTNNAIEQYNKDGAALETEIKENSDDLWNSYWNEDEGEVYLAAEEANDAIARSSKDINKGRQARIRVEEEFCDDLQELETKRGEDLGRVWKTGSNNYRVLATRSTNEIGTINRRVNTEKALEEVTAQEEIENTNADADAEIIQVIEQYEGDKIDETNVVNDEITSLTLTAEDDKKVERDTAQSDTQDAVQATNEEIAIINSDAGDQIADIVADGNARKSDVRLDFRDARSGLNDTLQNSLDNIRARWSPRIEALRNRVEQAENVLRRRPGANWSARLRRQLLQAQRKAERVFANSKKAIRSSKLKRDAQLAAARRNYNRKVARSKKAEANRIALIDRDTAAATAPIRESADREIRALRDALSAQQRVIEDRQKENIAIIDSRLRAQVASLTENLSELLLRLDRQKSNEAGAIDKRRDLAVLQRQRAKTRVITELVAEGDAEKEDVLTIFDEESSALVDEVDSEMRDIKDTVSGEIKDLRRAFQGETDSIDEALADAEDDIQTARKDFRRENISIVKDWRSETTDWIQDVKSQFGELKTSLRETRNRISRNWRTTGSSGRPLESARKSIDKANDRAYSTWKKRGLSKLRSIRKTD